MLPENRCYPPSLALKLDTLIPELFVEPRENIGAANHHLHLVFSEDHCHHLEANRLFVSASRPNLEAQGRKRVSVDSCCSSIKAGAEGCHYSHTKGGNNK